MRFPTLARGRLRRPIVPLIVESARGVRTVLDALVDTGADRTLLPISVAKSLKIDVSALQQVPVGSALGQRVNYALIDLFLELGSPPNLYRWRTRVGIILQPIPYGLLGTRGFFEFFAIEYNWPAGYVEILPTGPLPTYWFFSYLCLSAR
jgi:Aspartyl protease